MQKKIDALLSLNLMYKNRLKTQGELNESKKELKDYENEILYFDNEHKVQ